MLTTLPTFSKMKMWNKFLDNNSANYLLYIVSP